MVLEWTIGGRKKNGFPIPSLDRILIKSIPDNFFLLLFSAWFCLGISLIAAPTPDPSLSITTWTRRYTEKNCFDGFYPEKNVF